MENKVPPQNMEAEQAIIGGLLLDPSAWDEVAELVAERARKGIMPPSVTAEEVDSLASMN